MKVDSPQALFEECRALCCARFVGGLPFSRREPFACITVAGADCIQLKPSRESVRQFSLTPVPRRQALRIPGIRDGKPLRLPLKEIDKRADAKWRRASAGELNVCPQIDSGGQPPLVSRGSGCQTWDSAYVEIDSALHESLCPRPKRACPPWVSRLGADV